MAGQPVTRGKPVVYMVCTGNAARSPMAAAMLRRCDVEERIEVRSAGILVLDGQPIGLRTGKALARHGLVDREHRSRQLREADAADADLVVVMEPMHIDWVRSHLPEIAAITGSLRRLARDLLAASGAPSSHETCGDVAVSGVGGSAEVPQPRGAGRSARALGDACSVTSSLPERVASLHLADIEPEPWEEVADPGFGSQGDFDNCSDELNVLVAELYGRL